MEAIVRRKLPVRRSALRGSPALRARQSLSLLALPKALGNGRLHAGAGCARTVQLLQGEELIRVYGEGDGAVKAFCTVCGSSLFGGKWPHGRQISIRMGAFDDDPGIRPQFHTYVGSRAPWDQICDGLAQHEGPWEDGAAPPSGQPGGA